MIVLSLRKIDIFTDNSMIGVRYYTQTPHMENGCIPYPSTWARTEQCMEWALENVIIAQNIECNKSYSCPL
jgi:hypothetical protein